MDSSLVEQFEDFCLQRGVSIRTARASDGIAALLSFYRDVRIDRVSTENDADALLVQWGTYESDFGASSVEFDLVRQLTTDAEELDDQEIYQLHLTYSFDAQAPLKLPSGEKWCFSPDDLGAFELFLRESHEVRVLTTASPQNITLSFEQV